MSPIISCFTFYLMIVAVFLHPSLGENNSRLSLKFEEGPRFLSQDQDFDRSSQKVVNHCFEVSSPTSDENILEYFETLGIQTTLIPGKSSNVRCVALTNDQMESVLNRNSNP
mmetsp:Transcript_19669/g.22350  ORF Transcript_19669/g.22350 Transcript_19669/m.22350 type:complete len:112 (+) Transcript_19669:430-765(+)